MIYEYPEEFIIPVIYADNLKEKSSYRYADGEALRDWKLLILDDELIGHKMFQGNINIELNENDDMKYLYMDEDLFPPIYKESMINHNKIEESLEDENININKILSDIDNDYANSETIHTHREY